MSWINNYYYKNIPCKNNDCHNPCTEPVDDDCCKEEPSPCCPKPCSCCPKKNQYHRNPNPCCPKSYHKPSHCCTKPCHSESMNDNCHHYSNNKCCSVSCCIYPTITNFCCLLKNYSKMTRNIYSTDCCHEPTNGQFNHDFGICYGMYSSTACNDNTFGYIDINQLNCQIHNDYIHGNEVCCPSKCESNGTQIHQNIKIIDKSKFKIVFVFWYKKCNKYTYDIYYGEYNCASCCSEQICLKLCYYNSVYGNYCDNSSAESSALKIASQIVI